MIRRRALWSVCLAMSLAFGAWSLLLSRAVGAATNPDKAERQQVKQALVRLRDRFNVKDHRALVGQLPDEPVRKGPGGAYPVVTTAEAEYSVAERKAIRDELKAFFHEIPPEVQMFFKPVSIRVSGGRATVECQYYFKAKTPTRRSKGFVKEMRRGIGLAKMKRG